MELEGLAKFHQIRKLDPNLSGLTRLSQDSDGA